MRTFAAALVAASCGVAFLSADRAELQPANLSFSFKDTNGKMVPLSRYKGKVILLDFWATWCVPCKQEIPGFIELQKKFGDRGLQIVGLSVDDSMGKAKEYGSAMKMNYPILLAEGKEEILEAYDPIPSIPVSIVIDRRGRIVFRHLGIAAMDVFEKEIVPLL
ncbi:MAG TPA: TlpA disulfide reductase family protein [Vicinamibacterales bacterium]|nr:TlpA disulfide reductase family protein [Vicinamibacterales bacterium]